jgi:hypothetical protein
MQTLDQQIATQGPRTEQRAHPFARRRLDRAALGMASRPTEMNDLHGGGSCVYKSI